MFRAMKKYLYNNVYVNILQNSNTLKVYVEEIDYKGQSEIYEQTFKSSERPKMLDFALENIKRSPINYVSILDPSLMQGAAPTCNKDEIRNYCELDDFEYVCVDKSWAFYTSKFVKIKYQSFPY